MSPAPGGRAAPEAGLIWHTLAGEPYWDESVHYCFTMAEVTAIEAATAELYRLFLAAGAHVVARPNLLASFGTPAYCHAAIRAAWEQEPPALDGIREDGLITGNRARFVPHVIVV